MAIEEFQILFSFLGVDDNWGNDENQSLIPKDDTVSTYKETREQLLAEQDKVSKLDFFLNN